METRPVAPQKFRTRGLGIMQVASLLFGGFNSPNHSYKKSLTGGNRRGKSKNGGMRMHKINLRNSRKK